MSLIKRFQAATDHPQLGQDKVAREAVLMMRDYSRGDIGPHVMMRTAKTLRLGSGVEAGSILAGWLMSDGWLSHSAKPFSGKGWSAVYGYTVTPKFQALLAA